MFQAYRNTSLSQKIPQSKINSRSVAGPMGQMNRQQASDVPSTILFAWFLQEFFAKILSTYLFIFLKIQK